MVRRTAWAGGGRGSRRTAKRARRATGSGRGGSAAAAGWAASSPAWLSPRAAVAGAKARPPPARWDDSGAEPTLCTGSAGACGAPAPPDASNAAAGAAGFADPHRCCSGGEVEAGIAASGAGDAVVGCTGAPRPLERARAAAARWGGVLAAVALEAGSMRPGHGPRGVGGWPRKGRRIVPTGSVRSATTAGDGRWRLQWRPFGALLVRTSGGGHDPSPARWDASSLRRQNTTSSYSWCGQFHTGTCGPCGC